MSQWTRHAIDDKDDEDDDDDDGEGHSTTARQRNIGGNVNAMSQFVGGVEPGRHVGVSNS